MPNGIIFTCGAGVYFNIMLDEETNVLSPIEEEDEARILQMRETVPQPLHLEGSMILETIKMNKDKIIVFFLVLVALVIIWMNFSFCS